MDEKLADILKYLRLPGLLAHWDEILAVARKRRFSHARLLQHVLEQEYSHKSERARDLRLKRARIPEPFVIETFPFARQPKLDRKKILTLYDNLDTMTHCRNMIWIGPTGCGKTGLATSFLIHAIHQGYTGKYVSFPELADELYTALADHTEQKILKRYLSVDCLLIDELGYIELEPIQVGHFFTLMQKRHKHKPTLLTSNLGFSEWASFLKNDHLTAALIDRLTENSHVINMKNCTSLRPKLSQET